MGNQEFIVNELSRELFINRKNRVVIAKSEASKRFTFIRELSISNIDSDTTFIDTLILDFDTEQLTIFNDMLPGVLSLCKNEWRGDLNPVEIINEPSKRKNCSLCDAPNNKWVYNIKNSLNGIKMNVGSTCIDEFSGITLKEGKTRSQLEKEVKRRERLQSLTIAIPGIEKEVDRWESLIDKFDILIPIEYEEPYLKLGNEFKELYEEYINKNNDNKIIGKLKQIRKERDLFIETIQEYNATHQEQRYIATRAIVNWLKLKKDLQTIEELKKTGFVTYPTAPYIREREYITKVIDDLKVCFDDIGIQTIETDIDNTEKILIKPLKDIDLVLACPTKNFISHFGWKLFDENRPIKFSILNIFRVCKLHSRNSIDITLKNLRSLFIKTNFSLSLYNSKEQDYFTLNEVDIIDKVKEKVYVINLTQFVEEFKAKAFNVEKIENESIKKYLSELSPHEFRISTRAELKDLRQSSRDFNKKSIN